MNKLILLALAMFVLAFAVCAEENNAEGNTTASVEVEAANNETTTRVPVWKAKVLELQAKAKQRRDDFKAKLEKRRLGAAAKLNENATTPVPAWKTKLAEAQCKAEQLREEAKELAAMEPKERLAVLKRKVEERKKENAAKLAELKAKQQARVAAVKQRLVKAVKTTQAPVETTVTVTGTPEPTTTGVVGNGTVEA